MKCSLGFYCETKPEMVLIPMKWLLRKLFFREALLPLILLLFLLHASVLQPLQREIPWRTSLLVRVLVLILCFISFFPPITDILHLFYVTSLPFSFGETTRRSEQGWSGEDKVVGADAEEFHRRSRSLTPDLFQCPPLRTWVAAWGSWRTRRTAVLERSTPPWRDRRWRPRVTSFMSMCCLTSA